jgi:hypothetical protein
MNGRRYRHRKSGGTYLVVIDDAIIESSMERAVIYRSESDGRVWVRPHADFTDGRFEPIPL